VGSRAPKYDGEDGRCCALVAGACWRKNYALGSFRGTIKGRPRNPQKHDAEAEPPSLPAGVYIAIWSVGSVEMTGQLQLGQANFPMAPKAT